MAIQIQKRDKWSPDEQKPTYEEFSEEKIRNRIKYLAVGADGKGGEDIASNRDRNVIKIGESLNKIDIDKIITNITKYIKNGTKTVEIDEYVIKFCIENQLESIQYGILAKRILVSSLHKETPESFIDAMRYAYFNKTPNNEAAPQIREDILIIILLFEAKLERIIDHRRDYLLDYFGLVTLIRPGGVAYLAKDSRGKIIERPQYLFLRTAIEIHRKGLESYDVAENQTTLAYIKNTYDLMSLKYATHATPTLSNSGTIMPQLASCFLSCISDDSIEGIFESLKRNAMLCKNMGGIGLLFSNIRGTGSLIKSSGGQSEGIKPLLKVFDNIFGPYLTQGGKRKGSLAAYLDVWHADFIDFINMPRNTKANDENRTFNLFYSVIVNDTFMKSVEYECKGCNGDCPGMHYFMTPDICPGIIDSMGDVYLEKYKKYIEEKKYTSKIHARELMYEIIFTMINSGRLYVFNRDAASRSNNLENVGNINCSNLCTEITLPVRQKNYSIIQSTNNSLTMELFLNRYKDIPTERADVINDINNRRKETENINYNTNLISVCNLASVKLDTFIDLVESDDSLYLKVYDFDGKQTLMYFNINKFRETVKTLVRNIDNIIDNTYYPEKLTKKTNLAMRPIGIGVQGLADLFIKLNLPYESEKAQLLNYYIWYWMYHAAMEETIKLAEEKGHYPFYEGSPASKDILQFHTWPEQLRPNHLIDDRNLFIDNSHEVDWGELIFNLRKHGMRNSLLLAPMPTASTAQILGSAESFEPYTSNLFTRTTLAGQFQIVNPHLSAELEKRGQWNNSIINQLIKDNGSVKNLNIPKHAKEVYKTVYEISMKTFIRMAADRGRFICQSQSMNLYWDGTDDDADFIKNKIFSALIYGWKLGLKTLCYYTRIRVQTGQKIEMSADERREFFRKARIAAENGEHCAACN
jgi:ribonucleoside-diphosphate reductase alpha subunit